jgi:acyl dehydratase
VALNQDLKGKEYEVITFEVEPERVTQFAEAIGDRDPRFLDPEAARQAGFRNRVAPPTLATVIQILASAQVVPDQELGLNYMMVVHGEQEYEWRRPIVAGDVLTATPGIADIYARGPSGFLVVEPDTPDQNGEVVCVSRSTLLSRGTAEAS